MKKLLIALMLTIGISSVTFAMMTKHGANFDWQQLGLSSEQEKVIGTLQDHYFERLQNLRIQELNTKDKKQQMVIFRNEMISEIKNVLTNEQKQQASEIVITEMKSRIDKRLSFLIEELALTTEQEGGLKYVLSLRFSELGERKLISEIPDFNDRQQMIDQLDEVLPKMLSTQQLDQWQNIKEKRVRYINNRSAYS